MSIEPFALLARTLLSGVFLLLVGRAAAAQETFEIRDASKEYDLSIRIARCGGEGLGAKCEGAARIALYRKGSKSPLQVFNLPNVEFFRDEIAYNPETSQTPRGVYDNEHGLIFGDFNFDGRDDLAICNGHGGYGGPSYNVYLFRKKSGRFVENSRLSRLTEDTYLGLFHPDPRRKLLVAYWKSGCCYHETEKYRVINDRPILVERITEDATAVSGADDGFAVVTTRRLVNGRWVKRTRKEKLDREN